MRVVPSATGSVTNVARVSSSTADPDTLDWRSTTTTTVTGADLSLIKSATASVGVGGTIEYVLTLTNSGPDDALNVVVTDSLPASVTFVSATNGGTLSGTAVTWNKGTVASGVTIEDTVMVTAGSAGSLENIARVSTTTADPDSTDHRATASTSVALQQESQQEQAPQPEARLPSQPFPGSPDRPDVVRPAEPAQAARRPSR